ncbi:RNA polymerase II transcription factor B subunit 1 [Linderina macrospora]|uniref:RNA polymerase II transcription factor B subunit 1 n=1 Tax=Linderina macrospora TaxID=4868 RepID=A0ACC1JGN3_9FUNG|nr:RNA polymerase II transcription factor B subunit 1 [Linderina macrospora]
MLLLDGESLIHTSPTSCSKDEGTLYYTTKRILWVKQGTQTPNIVIQHEDFRLQQVSKADAKKVMLRISVMGPGQAPSDAPALTYTFAWKHANKEEALADRDKYVNELYKITPRKTAGSDAAAAGAGNAAGAAGAGSAAGTNGAGKGATSMGSLHPEFARVKIGSDPASADDIKLRQDVLSKNVDLAKLHRALVVSGLVSEEEFWSTRKHILETQAVQSQLRKGDSSTWLDLAPTTQDGGNFKYTITPNIAKRIFKEYPQVKRAYIDNVPHKIGEKQFWKRFLASRFFNRNRSTSAMKGNPDSIFDTCLRDEDNMLGDPERFSSQFIMRLLDLSRTEEDSVETGNVPDFTMRPGRFNESLSLIRRFNHHSELVLQSAIGTKRKELSAPSASEAVDRELDKAIVLPDLEVPRPEKRVKLNIQDQSRYLTSLVKGDVSMRSSDDEMQQRRSTFSISFDLSQSLEGCGNTQRTMAALTGSVRRVAFKSRPNRIKELSIPSSLNKAVEECYGAGTEMLRHLWAIMRVPMTPEKRQKADKIIAAFDSVHRHIRDTVTKANSAESKNANLGSTIEQMVQPVIDSLKAGKKEYERRVRGAQVSS